MYLVGLAYLLSLNLQQSVPITVFGAKASYHHDHKVDHVFVRAKVEDSWVHFSCKSTGHDFIAKFPRPLKICTIFWLETVKGQVVYKGLGIDTKGVFGYFSISPGHRTKAEKMPPSATKVRFSDNLANDPRFKDSEWRIDGSVIGFGSSDSAVPVIVMSTGRILALVWTHPTFEKVGTLHAPIPKSVLIKPIPKSVLNNAKNNSYEIYDRQILAKPLCVLDEYYEPIFPIGK